MRHTIRLRRSRLFGLVARCACRRWVAAGSDQTVQDAAERHLERHGQ